MTTFSADDHRYMARALELASRGMFSTKPNPRVGCVLVKDGVVVGEGWHRIAGGPHAEVEALNVAGERARGATAYVTLEPCSHHGKTPPCAEALLAAGVSEVVAAMVDPNPLVGGRGLRLLADSGIQVREGILGTQARELNRGFVRRMSEGRPFVRSKLAMSLDGRTAMASGESKWITGPAARADVQRLRAESSAVVTGIGTVLADDPSLNVRLESADVQQPLRVVLDPRLSISPQARVLHQDGPTVLATASDDQEAAAVLEAAGAEVWHLPAGADAVDLTALLGRLAARECNDVLVEAGARLSGAFLRAGLIDELVVYVAAKLMGDEARGLFHLPGLDTMAAAVSLELLDARVVGGDLRLTYRPKPSNTGEKD